MDAFIKDLSQDATAMVETASSQASKHTTAGPSLLGLLADEVQSAPTANLGFGSPHNITSTPPTSPLEGSAKLLDFDAGAKPNTPVPVQSPPTPTMAPLSPAPPLSPATPAAPAAAAAPSISSSNTVTAPGARSSGERVDYAQFVEETLLWVNKVRSTVYLLGGLLALYLLNALLGSGVALVTGVCWLLLAQAALNFVRGFINPKFQARCTWQDSWITALLLAGVTAAAQGAAALHDKHLLAPDASKALQIVAVLWAVSLAGRLANTTALAATLWVLAFMVPKVYLLNKDKVDKVATQIFTQAKAQFVRLDPKARAAFIVLPTFVAGYLLSRVDLCIALLALALYGRSFMVQAQVDKVNAAVAPVTATVTKVGDTVGGLVQSAVVKYELTPTPAKKKRE